MMPQYQNKRQMISNEHIAGNLWVLVYSNEVLRLLQYLVNVFEHL